jgi:polar amino acid transport system substrate-binding protein
MPVLFFAALLLVASSATAQMNFNPPNPPSEFLDARRQLAGDALRVCISSDSLLAPLDRAVALAIGEVLLVDVTLVEIPTLRNLPVLDHRVTLSQTELFTVMNNECPVFAGFLLSTSGFADWLTITRPYLQTRSVFATTDPAITALDAMPAGARIGTRIGANVDIRFLDLNQGRTEATRWRRVPYPNNGFLVDRLREGELDAILLWEPALVVGLDGDPRAAGVYPGATSPVVVEDQSFGFILLQRDGFVRGALDEAIAVLAEDGTLERLMASTGIPGVVPR